MKPEHEVAFTCPSVRGTANQAVANWELRNWNPGLVNWLDDYGLFVVRGWHSVTAENGLITKYRLRYDLSDPRTLRTRKMTGDIVFTLGALEIASSPKVMLLLSTATDPKHTPVVVYVGEPESGQEPMSIHIFERDSATSGQVAFHLNDIIDGHSETMLDVTREGLLTGRYGIEIRHKGDSKPIMRVKTLDLRSPLLA